MALYINYQVIRSFYDLDRIPGVGIGEHGSFLST